jgi:SAM-dependent methyltransferase
MPAVRGPSPWLLENADLLRGRTRALDVAAGRGRHALLLASAGIRVEAVDVDAAKMTELAETAERLGLSVATAVRDLEAEGTDLGTACYDLIVVVNYLHRPLFPALIRALAEGGLLLYETYTVDQMGRGGPTTRAFLLERGELPFLVAPLHILRAREGEHDGRAVSAVAAVRERRETS